MNLKNAIAKSPLTMTSLCNTIGVSPQTIYGWIKNGIPAGTKHKEKLIVLFGDELEFNPIKPKIIYTDVGPRPTKVKTLRPVIKEK